MSSNSFSISGNIVDVIRSTIYGAQLEVEGAKIVTIIPSAQVDNVFILPGFIDSHVHIESSMLSPVEFAKAAFRHGTIACVSDPHEIANVVGIDGVKFMIGNGLSSGMKFFFGAPSCVPATNFESSGSSITSDEVRVLLEMKNIKYLSEMMNFPGVLFDDPEVLRKINIAKKLNKKIDGHAPGLGGTDLIKYFNAGISTDHECTSIDEAIEKIKLGMHVLIREGSSAKNFDALYKLIDLYPDMVMLCSDDIHPDDLLKGHINLLIKRGLANNLNLFNLLRAATLNPIIHYGLDCGLLREKDPADFIVVNDLKKFRVIKTFIDGEQVFGAQSSEENNVPIKAINNFHASKISLSDISLVAKKNRIKVIEAIDKELITKTKIVEPKVLDGLYVSDVDRDVLKIVVYNRYRPALPTVAFVSNFGLKYGAIASSVAHDSHNIIAVGTNDLDIVNAINRVIDDHGAIVCSNGLDIIDLPLEIGGLMSVGNAKEVGEKYQTLDRKAKEYGSTLTAPFMTLSFMALLVIPELKISDKGLFDGLQFKFTTVDAE